MKGQQMIEEIKEQMLFIIRLNLFIAACVASIFMWGFIFMYVSTADNKQLKETQQNESCNKNTIFNKD